MAISRDDIFRKALALAPSDRVELVGLLIDSLDEGVEQGAEAAWLEEIDRRAQELESGAVLGIPWELVRERLVRAPRG
jgi:putative addiction module component (TIGR02574 family)